MMLNFNLYCNAIRGTLTNKLAVLAIIFAMNSCVTPNVTDNCNVNGLVEFDEAANLY